MAPAKSVLVVAVSVRGDSESRQGDDRAVEADGLADVVERFVQLLHSELLKAPETRDSAVFDNNLLAAGREAGVVAFPCPDTDAVITLSPARIVPEHELRLLTTRPDLVERMRQAASAADVTPGYGPRRRPQG